MSLIIDRSSEDETDLYFENCIGTESKKQQSQNLTSNLTSICWKICINHPTSQLRAKIEKCLVNCVELFINAIYFTTNRWNHIVLNKRFDLDLE